MKIHYMLLSVLYVLMSHKAFATDFLSLDEVLQSTLDYYPKIQAELARKQITASELLASQGVFDTKIVNESQYWALGFYDGKSIDTKIVKPLESFNGRIAGGYRVTDGTFPIYQNELITQTGGEFNLELWFSLLRNRDIDSRRVNVRNNLLSLEQADFKVVLTKLTIMRDASLAYWKWLGTGRRLIIYQSLLNLAKERQVSLEEQNRLGQVADIQVVENKRNILTRQSLVRVAEQQYRNATINLSLYYRNDAALPIVVTEESIPSTFPDIDEQITQTMLADLTHNQTIQPGLELFNKQIKQQENLESLAENSLLPQFDVGIKASKDIGRGSDTLDESDLEVFLSVEVPIGTRVQRGNLSKIRSKIDELKFERQLLQEQVNVQTLQLIELVKADITFINLTTEELALAERLETAEKIRFQEGASDFFLINLREQQTADAEIRHYQALEDYYTSLMNYYAATAQLDKFGIY